MVEILAFAAICIFVVGILWLVSSAPSQPQTTTYTLAHDFTLTDVDGNTFRLSDQQGKVVVLEFMRTTCEYCIAESPNLRELRANFGGDVVMVMISVDPKGDTDSVLRNYRNQNAVGWIAAADKGYDVQQVYGVQSTPTIFIIDKNGYIKYQHVGVTDSSILIAEVGSLT
jgi:cytochrome oxidase Cu insertion factor (SCO1/SenC/PrrC family)